MTKDEYDALRNRLVAADEIEIQSRRLCYLRETVERAELAGDYLHVTTLDKESHGYNSLSCPTHPPMSVVSTALKAWITQEEQRLTEELAKL